MRMKTRILMRTDQDGHRSYTIQQKHFLFRWWWVDAWVNSIHGANARTCSFPTLKEAKANLKYFDGTKIPDIVVK